MDTIIPMRQWNKMNEKNFPRLHEGPPPHLKVHSKNYSTYLQKLLSHQLLQESQDLISQMDLGPYKPHMAYKMQLILNEFNQRVFLKSPGLKDKMESIFSRFKGTYETTL